MTDLSARSVSYDPDTATLAMTLTNDDAYLITNAGHARAIKDKISPGGRLSPAQVEWLAQYRVDVRDHNRTSLRARLKTLRAEIATTRKR